MLQQDTEDQHLRTALLAPCPRDAHAGNSSMFGHDVMRAVVPGGSVSPLYLRLVEHLRQMH